MRKILFILTVLVTFWGPLETQSWAVADQVTDKTTEHTKKGGETKVAMTALDAVKLAGQLVKSGDYEHAVQLLTKMPKINNLSVEIERWYLLAQIEQKKGNIDEAIKIYRKILDDQPDLSKIRYELALCYMEKHQWYRADYHLRLAMAGKDIPPQVKQAMLYYRWLARQNKNWNVWFNFGAAPDTNVNQATGGKECIVNEWGRFCRKLPEPEKVIGMNLMLGGDYEFKLSEHWRWKNEGTVYTSVYDKHQYDDLYLSASTGPRYIWNRGDVWLAGIVNRRWYGGERYNWGYGGRLDINYDWTRKLSSGLSLRIVDGTYDDRFFKEYMSGQVYSLFPHITYSIDSTKYFVLRGTIEREILGSDAYSNRKFGAGIGFGAELPYGFNVYIEPYFLWSDYDGEKWVAKDGVFQPVIENDFSQRYSLSLSNNKFDVWGFVPTFILSYTNKDSNIHSRKYEKWTAEFTMRQRF